MPIMGINLNILCCCGHDHHRRRCVVLHGSLQFAQLANQGNGNDDDAQRNIYFWVRTKSVIFRAANIQLN